MEKNDKIKVLLVEDDPDIVKLTLKTLQIDGFNVFIATSLEEAMAKIKNKERLDIVLLDIFVEGNNGIQILDYIKKETIFKNTKVIVFTTIAEKEKIENFYRLGADDVVIKPFDSFELIEKIKKNI